MRIGLFTPDRAFDMVSKAQIAKLREPSIKLVDLVTTEMMNMCKDASAKVNLPKKNTTVVQINPFLRGEGGEESRGGVSCVLPSLSLCTPHTHILHLCCNTITHTHFSTFLAHTKPLVTFCNPVLVWFSLDTTYY